MASMQDDCAEQLCAMTIPANHVQDLVSRSLPTNSISAPQSGASLTKAAPAANEPDREPADPVKAAVPAHLVHKAAAKPPSVPNQVQRTLWQQERPHE